jgi:hypothetical protein
MGQSGSGVRAKTGWLGIRIMGQSGSGVRAKTGWLGIRIMGQCLIHFDPLF